MEVIHRRGRPQPRGGRRDAPERREAPHQRPPPKGEANPGRVAAALALIAVEEGDHVEDALDRYSPPTGPDRGLAWFLALGVLRHRPQVDAALRSWLTRPLSTLDAPVRAALRVGAYEKLFARTAPHAVVQQAVEVAGAVGAGRASGMVNAVLRRVAPAADLSRGERLDHPDWLVERWTRRYGEAAADRWCIANGEPAPLALVARSDVQGLKAALLNEGLSVRPATAGGIEVPGALWVDDAHRPVPSLPGFAEGRFWVQDPASARVADLLPLEPGDAVLDACAAPGGKSFRLAARGALVTAVDRDPERLALLHESAERMRFSIATLAHDWETGPHPTLGRFDAILVDAPCTGLGTVRRHPEIRWRRAPTDPLAMQARQRRVLDGLIPHLAPGGVLVYAVCSPEPEEGPEVVHAFAAARGARVEAELLTAPPTADEDAFYAARIRLP